MLLLDEGLARWAERRESAWPRDRHGTFRGAAPLALGPEGAERAVLLLHGYASSPADFGVLPERLAERGLRVEAPLLPGHGRGFRELERASAADWLEAARRAIEGLRRRHSCVSLLGFSLGGALAFRLAAEEEPERLVLAAPFFALRYRPWYVLPPLSWGRLLGPALRWVPNSPRSHRAAGVEGRLPRPPLLPSRHFPELQRASAWAREAAACTRLSCPVLLLHGRRDGTTSFAVARREVGRAAAGELRVVELAGDHLLFWDRDAARARQEVLDFLAPGEPGERRRT